MFKDKILENTYQTMLQNPPKREARALSDNFWAGFDGIEGVRKGVPTSMARAAWLAGKAYRGRLRHEEYVKMKKEGK
jgi:hypothetical protein